ncbi:MAG: helix-turn-helix domain-containing protein [Candidatus Nitrotoga sp.]|jgi:Fis family transcriptional regulator, factor for inversion stimulation protein|nr:helix-turn-helix domain-containing protein [Candidatus Nitrotoga sp.]MDW7604792.1 helix-turn-helix domain-containing protein [Candidatus Nitrotoga sp.]MDW7612280.1 helix-turn-helix domain-containing protein [Candidatus Nitrotoga sp.]MDW7625503.1 helix-turn-helix domain-containing protein [Candidatus Nitrotoga sp.]
MFKKVDPLLCESDIAQCVRESMLAYFEHLGGVRSAQGIYEMFMDCVEKPLIEVVLQHTNSNKTQAAKLLGINRNLLNNKIQQHGILTEVLETRLNTRRVRKIVVSSKPVKKIKNKGQP